MTASTSACVADAGQVALDAAMPISAQSLCLPPTYQCEPGSSPTSTVPSPGTMPRSLQRRDPLGELGLDGAPAVAVPSRIRAVMGVILSVPSEGSGAVVGRWIDAWTSS